MQGKTFVRRDDIWKFGAVKSKSKVKTSQKKRKREKEREEYAIGNASILN